MNAALYVTIWIALALFALGAAGRSLLGDRVSARRWPWHAWVLGIASCAIHFALAFGVRHGWSHDAAVRATATQTAAVYGIDWGGGVYVNYVFLAAWAIDAWHWRSGRGLFARPRVRVWLQAFYLLIIVNAAVIFASGWRRRIGVVIVAMILAAALFRSVPGLPRSGARSGASGSAVPRF